MKKLKTIFCMLVVLMLMTFFNINNNVFAAATIDSQYLFIPSTFDTLVLNYSTLPNVSVSGSQGYTIQDGTTGSGHPRRGVYYTNTGSGQTLDSRVTVDFSNCGTLNGRPINMKLVYSDIVTNGADAYLYWSAFGSTMTSNNEWWYACIEHVNVDIYFYYVGESTPINIDVAYLSIFSEDNGEGAGSSQTSEVYIYGTTNMAHASTLTSVNGWRQYTDVYYGTLSGSTEAGSLNCVSFQYKRKDHLNIKLYGINKTNIGYHFQYTPLTATLPSSPTKMVNKTESQLGDTITYTINQKISMRFDSSFHYSAMVFKDTLNTNLTYNSLRVYNENGTDVTVSAGTTSYNSSTKQVTYTFNSSYLNSMPYNGQTYRFVISANVNDSSNIATIPNSATTVINNAHTLNSNTVNTTLKSKVVVHYVNKQGVKIADDVTINGNLLDTYTTSSKNIYGYQLVGNSGNTSGTMTKNTTEVTYTYDLIKVNMNLTKTLEATASTPKQNLAGASFKLEAISFEGNVGLASPTTTYYSTATDANGNCTVTGLPYGTYKITEHTIPSKAYAGIFFLNGATNRISSFNVTLNENKTYSYSLEDVAKKMNITVIKEDKETEKITQGDAHLEGAQYTIYRDQACTDAIETITIAKQADGTYSATSKWYLVGTYYVRETRAPEGYLIDENVYTVTQDPSRQTTEYSSHSITSKDEVIRNDIEITKYIEATDSTEKQSLAGAVFSATLNSDPSKVYYSSVTNANGYCKITELPYGTYTIKESTLPATAYNGEFYIDGSNERKTTFEQFIQVDNSTNDPYVWSDITDVAEKMQITVYKEDIETGTTTQGDAHLEGAEYTLYKEQDCRNAIETITIEKQADGTYSAKSGWYLVGTYYVKETKAPEGYLIDETVYTVSQDPAAQTEEHSYHSITSKDEVIRNDIEIIKNLEATDSTEKQSLAGAVFSATLNSDTSKVYYSSITDENGYCIITELPYGTYTLRESTLPDVAYNREFYVGDSTTRVTTFEQFIEVDNSINEPYVWGDITDVAEKMQITIFKEDIETGTTTQGDAHLEGAEYTLYRDEACTDAIETITIEKQADGTYSAKSGWYLVGKYWMKETKAPEGYLIDETVYSVEQNPAEQTAEHSYHSITSKDEVIRNDIEIIKNLEATDSTEKQSLAGAVFSATLNSDPTKVYYSSVTDENGYCIITELPYGIYTIKESTIPPTAYNGEFYIDGSNARNTTFEQFIEVDNSTNEPYKWGDITDVAEKMQITIYKEDLEKGNNLQGDATLEGAEYTLYRDEACTDAIETITIAKDEDGRFSAKSGWYLVGTYWMKETKAPEGYLIDEQVYKVSQDPVAQTEEYSYHSITSKDQVMKGFINLIKYNNNSSSSDKIPAEGAVLILSLNSNPDKYYEAIVDENGYAEFVDEDYRDTQYPYTIPYGKYTISEVKTSDTGEHIFINKQQTSIEYQQQENKYILDDEYVRLRFTIEKYDVETDKKLAAGATFKIWDANNNCWYSEMLYPSGKFITEFTTNDQGQLTINRHLESGAYVLYEVKAPEGYVLEDEGYSFFIGVGENGDVVAEHNGVQKTLEYETIKYDNIPTKMYKYTAEFKNMPQKAVVEVTKLAEQLTRFETTDTQYGKLNTPVYEEKGLKGVTFKLTAAEDVVTPEGTVRYTKGQVVSTFTTDANGIATSEKVYLGKYILEEISTVNGYVLDTTPVELNIEYTTQDEEVQTIKVEKKNEKQEVNLTFEKVYKELQESRFKFTDRKAVFGVYTASNMLNYKNEEILTSDELVDILETNENNMLENNIELPEGEYYVKELYVSNPYGKLDDKFEFEVEYINTNNQSIDVTINNEEVINIANTAVLGMYKFSDLDYINLDIENITDLEEIEELASMYGVAGATYKVYNDAECTDPVITIDDTEAEFITDENGTIYIEDMPWGT
ncbi:MAG: MucBP domain-containing protein, partial [Clostridia bacterium]|nr:MucBP domain-containing protein [Clostridia bacterium]